MLRLEEALRFLGTILCRGLIHFFFSLVSRSRCVWDGAKLNFRGVLKKKKKIPLDLILNVGAFIGSDLSKLASRV